jgi:hypothetical protein
LKKNNRVLGWYKAKTQDCTLYLHFDVFFAVKFKKRCIFEAVLQHGICTLFPR